MKEGKIEKITTKKEKEKTILEELIEIKEKEKKEMKENPKHNSAWKHIDPRKITEENMKIYDLYKNGKFDAAKNSLVVAKEKAGKGKNQDNIDFLQLIDDQIELARLNQQSQTEQQKDNL